MCEAQRFSQSRLPHPAAPTIYIYDGTTVCVCCLGLRVAAAAMKRGNFTDIRMCDRIKSDARTKNERAATIGSGEMAFATKLFMSQCGNGGKRKVAMRTACV